MRNSYNGYTWNDRMAKYREMQRRLESRELAWPCGPCQLCNDPGGENTGVAFEYHDEDYSREYRWSPPAAYVLCRDCHVYRVHQRFRNPWSWFAFLAHVRRGGYAREMRDTRVKAEVANYRRALMDGGPTPSLSKLREYSKTTGAEWFA